MKNYQIYKLFPTPVFHFRVENYQELNTELENYILDLRKKDEKGQKKSNAGGWHSHNFDLANDNTAKKFAKIFEKFYKKVIINEMGWKYDSNKVKMEAMWSIINKKGSFNIQHNHANAYLSSAYYVRYPEKSGSIKFFDPREQKNIRYPKIKNYTDISAVITEITPKEGDLLIFPSYLYHSVGENLSEDDRIIVSFNINIDY
ncbi:uncharacterized protein METZ01_LOCUS433494 [marine metagenome]|uniref:JmjC domain-containing protein n=1 Tax=marine metagenome TaxID=408172 RepID=A0A382YC21_9ZZZZ